KRPSTIIHAFPSVAPYCTALVSYPAPAVYASVQAVPVPVIAEKPLLVPSANSEAVVPLGRLSYGRLSRPRHSDGKNEKEQSALFGFAPVPDTTYWSLPLKLKLPAAW